MAKKDSISVTCKRCGYSWDTKGKHYYVPCPRCHTLNKIRELPPISAE